MLPLLKNQTITAGYVLRYCRGLPHWPQNCAPAVNSAPQPEQLAAAREAPHCRQKRASRALALPHLRQVIAGLLSCG
jgi:hypothetical protein